MDGGGGAGGARLDVAPADAVPVIDSVRVEIPAVDGTAVDAPLPTDVPITLDGGAIDVALPLDGGTTVDTGKAVDAGAVDTGKAVDGAAPAETQAPLDGGTPDGRRVASRPADPRPIAARLPARRTQRAGS
jgi:hypothetical protein